MNTASSVYKSYHGWCKHGEHFCTLQRPAHLMRMLYPRGLHVARQRLCPAVLQASPGATRSAPACQPCSPSAAGGRSAPHPAARCPRPSRATAQCTAAAPLHWEICATTTEATHHRVCSIISKVTEMSSLRPTLMQLCSRQRESGWLLNARVAAPVSTFGRSLVRQLHRVGGLQHRPGNALRDDLRRRAHIRQPFDWNHPCAQRDC